MGFRWHCMAALMFWLAPALQAQVTDYHVGKMAEGLAKALRDGEYRRVGIAWADTFRPAQDGRRQPGGAEIAGGDPLDLEQLEAKLLEVAGRDFQLTESDTIRTAIGQSQLQGLDDRDGLQRLADRLRGLEVILVAAPHAGGRDGWSGGQVRFQLLRLADGRLTDLDTGPAVESRRENTLGMSLVLIPPGEFWMGTSEADVQRRIREVPNVRRASIADETPQHRVRITRPFYLGRYEVTVGEFGRFVDDTGYRTEPERDGRGGFGFRENGALGGRRPEFTWRNLGVYLDDSYPVVNVTWNDAVRFCQWLTQREGQRYRLPTEAEWEYACRAGTKTYYASGDSADTLSGLANVSDASLRRLNRDIPATAAVRWEDGFEGLAPVGVFAPNPFGVCDMHGNVYEWCQDRYGAEYYANSPQDDPQGPDAGTERVQRGGSFDDHPGRCRSAYRQKGEPSGRGSSLGFRVVCEIP